MWQKRGHLSASYFLALDSCDIFGQFWPIFALQGGVFTVLPFRWLYDPVVCRFIQLATC